MKHYLACLALVQLAVPASVYAAKPPAEPGSPNERICKTVEGTGWRLGRQRLCKTRAEWEKLTREAQEEMNADRRGNAEGTN